MTVDRAPGWRYLELVYDTHDPTRLRVDGSGVTDGRSARQVIATLGAAGWEMVASTPGVGTEQVLWFKRPVAAYDVGPPSEPAGGSATTGVAGDPPPDRATYTVVLVDIGTSRFDRAHRARLIAALRELSGESGWRATRMVDKAPRVVADGVTADEAAHMRRTLEGLGATVEVR